ncbi:hypothetical protein AXF42_Ash004174 [Apostasia shenzhenica]|uniref:DUF7866 domain-containing protein n=1 Tax=Apostasia shenzhenica TaxID=1088818 RepID=A0A2I0A288_9ASPA|nr:hypothetical protein AXF42_Ash004174 [Apostasia shenzhenica]
MTSLTWAPRLLFLLLFTSPISTEPGLSHVGLSPLPYLFFSFAANLSYFWISAQAAEGSPTPAATPEMRPVAAAPGLRSTVFRRQLGSFQICALCTCCGGPRGLCLPSPCCYSINCNIPNRPFGYCSFTPRTCNCFGCHL